MNKNIKSYLNLFWQLLKTELIIHKKTVVGSMIDVSIFVTVLVFVFAYLFPALGMNKDFGAFYAVGMIASICFFEIFTITSNFVSDIDGNKTINYFAILPMPSWFIFVSRAIGYACKTILMTIIIIPLAKLLLWNRMDLTNFATIKFILMFLSINLFGGFFGFFVVSFVKNMPEIGKVWRRFIFPLWFFGGSDFPWKVLHNVYPKLGYLALLNPLLYPMEGIRSAVLGKSQYLPFWFSLVMVIALSLFFGWIGTVRLMKRLDFV
mgnify:CR=1 FL=1|jgi:ABC-type polysaccharide/polyol phosphate export permease